MREEQARRELEHVKREKEKIVDQNSELALALKYANDDLFKARNEIDLLKDKVNFYEKTFPLTITRQKKHLAVPTLNLHSEPTHQDRLTIPDNTSTLNTGAKQGKELREIHSNELKREQDRLSEKASQL